MIARYALSASPVVLLIRRMPWSQCSRSPDLRSFYTIVWIVGFGESSEISQVTRADRINMASLFLPVYCGLTLVSAAILHFYRIKKSDHEDNLRMLAARRASLG